MPEARAGNVAGAEDDGIRPALPHPRRPRHPSGRPPCRATRRRSSTSCRRARTRTGPRAARPPIAIPSRRHDLQISGCRDLRDRVGGLVLEPQPPETVGAPRDRGVDHAIARERDRPTALPAAQVVRDVLDDRAREARASDPECRRSRSGTSASARRRGSLRAPSGSRRPRPAAGLRGASRPAASGSSVPAYVHATPSGDCATPMRLPCTHATPGPGSGCVARRCV